jgi:GrpB-like predicted nucleotidyltransferase (UPF0157 family)
MRIETYTPGDAKFCPYDRNVVEVARRIAAAIEHEGPELRVEHMGSTAVPGCGGKGIVDLAVLYPDGLLARARQVLDDLGFQKQTGREPFPETRPMRVGACRIRRRCYQIHAHVIAGGSHEQRELLWFRDRLRADVELVRRYERRKREILASGIIDATDYCKAKGDFITHVVTLQTAIAGA